MIKNLTDDDCLAIYCAVWDDVAAADTERGRDIIAEMRAIAKAPDLDAAVNVVEWWGNDPDDLRTSVAKARALLRGESELALTPAAILTRWSGALAALAEGPAGYGAHDVEALAATTEQLAAEVVRLRREINDYRKESP